MSSVILPLPEDFDELYDDAGTENNDEENAEHQSRIPFAHVLFEIGEQKICKGEDAE